MVLDWGPRVKVLKPSEYGVWPLSIVPYASVGQGSKPSSDYSISSYSNCQQGRRLGPAPSNRRPQWVAFIDKSRTIGVESLPFFSRRPHCRFRYPSLRHIPLRLYASCCRVPHARRRSSYGEQDAQLSAPARRLQYSLSNLREQQGVVDDLRQH
jgi:hypothetical protein